jgi:hypothetical protein
MTKHELFIGELAQIELSIIESENGIADIHTQGKVDAGAMSKLGTLGSKLSVLKSRRDWLKAKIPYAKLEVLRNTLKDRTAERIKAFDDHKAAKALAIEELRPRFGHNTAGELANIAEQSIEVTELMTARTLASNREHSAQVQAFQQADLLNIFRGWEDCDLGI